MGICTSAGVVRDFAGPYTIGEDEMAFGWPAKLWQLSPALVQTDSNGAALDWDSAVNGACDVYRGRMLMKQKQQLPSSSSDLDCAECGFIIPKSVGNYHRCSVCLLSAHLDCSARLFPASLIAKVGAASSSSSSVCRFCSQNSACQKCDDSGSNNSDNSETCSCLVCERPVLSSAEQFTQCPSCLLGVHRHCIVNTDARAASYRQLFQRFHYATILQFRLEISKGFGNAEATSGGSSKLNSDGSSATFGSATLKPTLKTIVYSSCYQHRWALAQIPAIRESKTKKPQREAEQIKNIAEKEKSKLLAKSKPARPAKANLVRRRSLCGAVPDLSAGLCHDDPECSADVFPSPPRCRLCQSGATCVHTPAGADDRLFNADGSEECPMCLNSLPSQVATPDCCPHHRFCPHLPSQLGCCTRICPLDRAAVSHAAGFGPSPSPTRSIRGVPSSQRALETRRRAGVFLHQHRLRAALQQTSRLMRPKRKIRCLAGRATPYQAVRGFNIERLRQKPEAHSDAEDAF
uniref:Phorbol-ester/DAG-type domain-containing protein n=1 Tax=Macrostomum lignano TaxID=282301 RepID=A0A1I8FBF4_9PLAT